MYKENWRLSKYIGRSEICSDGGEKKVELPKHLYRQVPIGDLYYVFKNKELPLQHFKGAFDSQIEKNSIGNFWFSDPVIFDKKLEGYIVTEPDKWKQKPEYVQESKMSFNTSYSSEPSISGIMYGIYIYPKASVPEFHTGNRLKKDEFKIFINEYEYNKLQQEYEILLDFLKNGSNNYDGIEPLIRRISSILQREFGNLEINYKDKAKYELTKNSKEWIQFYEWVLKLSIIPVDNKPSDVDDITVSDSIRIDNEKKFLEFYNKTVN